MCYLGRLVEAIVIVLNLCSATEECNKSLKLNQYHGPVFNRLFILMYGASQFELKLFVASPEEWNPGF